MQKTTKDAKKRTPKKVKKKATSGNAKRLAAIKNGETDGYSRLSVKVRDSEFIEFCNQTDALNISNNAALRVAARRIAGFIELDQETKSLMKDISKQISGVSNNINQLAKIANKTNSIDHSAFLEERKQLGAQLVRFDVMQQKILSAALRKSDGLAMLEKGLEDDQI